MTRGFGPGPRFEDSVRRVDDIVDVLSGSCVAVSEDFASSGIFDCEPARTLVGVTCDCAGLAN
jgi:hypothetical protein